MMPSIFAKSTDSHPSGLTRLTDWPRRGSDWSCYQNSWIGWPHANVTGLWLYYRPTSIFRHSSLTCLMELCFHADNMGKSFNVPKTRKLKSVRVCPGHVCMKSSIPSELCFWEWECWNDKSDNSQTNLNFLSEFMELHSVRYWTWS